jgi:hypothetical protein
MILVNCAWRHADIIRVVESVRLDDQNVFKFVKVEGIRIFFDTFLEDIKGVKLINESIKSIPGYQALGINIVPVVNNSMFDGYNKLLYK